MWQTRLHPHDVRTARQHERRSERLLAVWLGFITIATLVVAFLLSRAGVMGPDPVLLLFIAYVAGGILILIRPRYGIYLILFLALVGDARLLPAYPFTKNFSSPESILYLNDAAIVSPLEVYLLLTVIGWVFSAAIRRRPIVRRSELYGPALFFTAFLVLGLVYGLFIRHGDVRIGLWEARPIFYLPIMLLLARNLLRTPQQINVAIWAVMLALFIEGLIGTYYYFHTLGADLSAVRSITEHSAAVQMNTLFLLAMAAWIYGASWRKRFLLPLMALALVVPYLATQRRAAFITLGLALVLMLVILFRERRRLFWILAPALFLGGVAYLAAFWNSSSALGLPAEAVRSVVSRNVGNVEDWSSNFYRILENANISYTLHNAPLQGVGFGNPFYIRVVMPDISFFEWWQYITHNSILWIWMKTGAGGFIALITLVGVAIMLGVRALWHLPGGDISAIAAVLLFYIIMHFTYAYVDISWDNQSMLYLGTAMGILSGLAPRREATFTPSAWYRTLWRRWQGGGTR